MSNKMNKLYVMYGSEQVGILERDAELVYSFQYTDHWLGSVNKFPLSLALKLEKKIYGNKDALAFFENLLPEGDIKASIEKSQDVHGVFDFLAKYGQDCAGAITITADKNYKEPKSQTELIHIEEIKIYTAIEEKKSVAEIIAEENPGYLSIAGAQDKFPAIYQNKKFFLPKNGAPTTHIIKTPIYRNNITDSVYNELFCMKLAQKIGFNIPDCLVHQGKFPLYVIARYDRQQEPNNKITRLHQQDFCQAQGLTSEFKYEDKGGPTVKNNYDLILENVTGKKRIESINTFLEWIAFNLLIGNNDSHSKNISFLTKNNRYELAPLYDLICTAIYPKLQSNFCFKIGNRTDYTKIGKNEFIKLDKSLELKEGTFQDIFQKIHTKLMKHKDGVIKEIEKDYGKIKILPRINDLIESRAETFRNQKGLD
jgi:serine/threonine-protein kinase HipA